MNITSKKWTSPEQTTIEAVIDGVTMFIPNDMANMHRQAIQNDIDNGGDPIADYVSPAPTNSDVNTERNRRISSGFTFSGKVYDFDPKSKANISGATLNAFMAIVGGAQAGDLRWHGGNTDFAWIAQDNTLTTMDAQTVVAFGQTAAAHESAHIFAAKAIKDNNPIPSDYTDDVYWP
jgi:hypothetical protein